MIILLHTITHFGHRKDRFLLTKAALECFQLGEGELPSSSSLYLPAFEAEPVGGGDEQRE